MENYTSVLFVSFHEKCVSVVYFPFISSSDTNQVFPLPHLPNVLEGAMPVFEVPHPC